MYCLDTKKFIRAYKKTLWNVILSGSHSQNGLRKVAMP